jgi:hypothetical protein
MNTSKTFTIIAATAVVGAIAFMGYQKYSKSDEEKKE